MRPALIATGLLLLSFTGAQPDDPGLLPLEPGWIWHLSNHQIRDWHLETDRETRLLGITVRVIEETYTDIGSGSVLHAESYWSLSDAGDLLLHGYVYPDFGVGEYYQPPVVYIYYPWLEPGRNWMFPGIATIFNEWETIEVPYAFHQNVESCEEISVPAGSFLCYGLEPRMVYGGIRSEGSRSSTPGMAPWLGSEVNDRVDRARRIYFSSGHGLVRRDISNIPDPLPYLLDWWESPTSTSAANWSAIKALY